MRISRDTGPATRHLRGKQALPVRQVLPASLALPAGRLLGRRLRPAMHRLLGKRLLGRRLRPGTHLLQDSPRFRGCRPLLDSSRLLPKGDSSRRLLRGSPEAFPGRSPSRGSLRLAAEVKAAARRSKSIRT